MVSSTTVTYMALCVSIILLSNLRNCDAFIPIGNIVDRSKTVARLRQPNQRQQSLIQMAATDEEKAAPLISGADLEVLLADLDTPLVIDAYATWYGDS
jgi:hypothetical protein